MLRRAISIMFLILSLALVAGCKKQDTPPEDQTPPVNAETPPKTDGDNNSTTPPVTTTPPSDAIKVGNVELDAEAVKDMQARADAGEDTWLLEPLEVAKREAAKFGFADGDTFHLISQVEAGEGSGTGEAIVQVVHKGSLYFMQLIQPSGPGEDSIWWVNAVLRDAK